MFIYQGYLLNESQLNTSFQYVSWHCSRNFKLRLYSPVNNVLLAVDKDNFKTNMTYFQPKKLTSHYNKTSVSFLQPSLIHRYMVKHLLWSHNIPLLSCKFLNFYMGIPAYIFLNTSTPWNRFQFRNIFELLKPFKHATTS